MIINLLPVNPDRIPPTESPFWTELGHVCDVPTRLDRVRIFTPSQCRAALDLPIGELQQRVLSAIRGRVRELHRRGLVNPSEFPEVFSSGNERTKGGNGE